MDGLGDVYALDNGDYVLVDMMKQGAFGLIHDGGGEVSWSTAKGLFGYLRLFDARKVGVTTIDPTKEPRLRRRLAIAGVVAQAAMR